MGKYILHVETIHRTATTDLSRFFFFLEDHDARQFMPSDEELSAAEELGDILEMFHDATEIISGENYQTLGIVHPLLQ